MIIYEIINIGKGVITNITPSNLLLIEDNTSVSEIEHNNLQGLNIDDYQHLTQSQLDRILNLIYENSINLISNSPSIGERGLATNVNVTYNIDTNDDIFTSASINQGIGNVLPNINTGNNIVTVNNLINTTTFTLSLGYTRKGVPTTETKNSTYTTYVPQWIGISANTDYTTYSGISADLEKFVQANNLISKSVSPTNQYIWIISTADITNVSTLRIRDANNFAQTVGSFNDGVSEFYKKTLNLTLANGVTTANVFLYRSRQTKTLSNFIYKIS